MLKQAGIFLVNVFCKSSLKRTSQHHSNTLMLVPPLGVLLLCGPEMDMIINCILFLLAIIPSHVHAFYISMTYFHRKRKVRKGKYPGPRRAGIYSEKVQNGGASSSEVRRLKKAQEAEGPGLTRLLSGRSGRSEHAAMRRIGSQKTSARASSQRYSGVDVPQRISSRRSAY